MDSLASRLFNAIAEMEFNDLVSNYDEFSEWTQSFGDVEPFPENECGKLSMSQAEQKWVVLQALTSYAREKRDDDRFDGLVYGDLIVEALSRNGFAPSFEVNLMSACQDIWDAIQPQALSLVAPSGH